MTRFSGLTAKVKRSHLIAAAIALVVAGWIFSGQIGESRGVNGEAVGTTAGAAAEEALLRVQVETLVAREHVREIVLFGRTEAERMVNVMTETSGRVAEVTVGKGERVAAGDVLVKLALDDRRARLAEAEALVEQRRIAYEAAKALSQKAYRSKVTLAQNKADLEAAQAALERIRLDIEHCTVRAPFEGIVDALPAEIGFFVNVGTIVAQVIDLDPVLIVGQVAERNIGEVDLGAPASARLVTGERVEGAISYIAKVADPATRTFRVEVSVPNAEGRVAEGLTAELRLPAERVSAHRVSPAVLTLSDEGVVGIKAVGPDNVVAFYPAEIVADSPDGMWLGGLPETVRLITVGQEFVNVGQKVEPVPASEGKPS